jgi:hypothetical protein
MKRRRTGTSPIWSSKKHSGKLLINIKRRGTNGNSEIKERREAFHFKSGAVYEGEWKGNMREGVGVQEWPDKARYDGEWKDNKANGKGKFWHVDGDICNKNIIYS